MDKKEFKKYLKEILKESGKMSFQYDNWGRVRVVLKISNQIVCKTDWEPLLDRLESFRD